MHSLDLAAQNLLALLVSRLPFAKEGEPRTFLGYKEAHDLLELQQVRESYGESLKAQGLASLAEWTHKTDKPGITGLVVDRSTHMPGKGYFNLFSRDQYDFDWWNKEIKRSKEFDWSPYLPQTAPPISPLAIDINSPPDREQITTHRVIRDTLLARRVKQTHNYACQLCGHSIALADGSRYAEAHHIQPLGEPHNGPDVLENIICLCPNHHVEFDYGVRPLDLAILRMADGHSITENFVSYHNKNVYRKP